MRCVQTSVSEFAEAGTQVLQVSAADVECVNSSCIAYSLQTAHDNSAFVIDSRTGLLCILTHFFCSQPDET